MVGALRLLLERQGRGYRVGPHASLHPVLDGVDLRVGFYVGHSCGYVSGYDSLALLQGCEPLTKEEIHKKISALDEYTPGWRELCYPNGNPKFSPRTGTMLNDDGTRSIFDDVDE